MKKHMIIILFTVFTCGVIKAQVPIEYLEIALENNPGLQAEYKRFEASLQEVTKVQSLPDPTFTAGYFLLPVETRVGPQVAKFSLSQMFPWFGTLKARGNAAALTAEADYQAFVNARNELFYNVSELYFQLYEVTEKQNLEIENLDLLESYKTIATRKFTNGPGTMADVLRTGILIEESKTTLKILEIRKQELVKRFNLLLNRETGEEVRIIDSLSHPGAGIILTDTTFQENPRIKALEYEISASKSRKQVAIKEGMPRLGIGMDYTVVGERQEIAQENNGKDILMPMVSISIPIFRSRYNAAIREAEIDEESYKLKKESLTNSLKALHETIVFELKQKKERLILLEKQTKEIERVLSLLFSAYSHSGKEYEEVLDIQQQLLKYEKQKAIALAAYYTSLARANFVLSGTSPVQ